MSLDIGDAFSMILPCPQWQDISNGPNPQWISCTSLKISSFNSIFFPPVAGGLHLCPKIVKSLLVFRENGGKGSGQSLCFSCICCSALLGLHQEDGLLRTLILYCPHLNLFCKYWGGLWRRAWKWLQIFLCSQGFYILKLAHTQLLAICYNFQMICYCCCCQVI